MGCISSPPQIPLCRKRRPSAPAAPIDRAHRCDQRGSTRACCARDRRHAVAWRRTGVLVAGRRLRSAVPSLPHNVPRLRRTISSLRHSVSVCRRFGSTRSSEGVWPAQRALACFRPCPAFLSAGMPRRDRGRVGYTMTQCVASPAGMIPGPRLVTGPRRARTFPCGSNPRHHRPLPGRALAWRGRHGGSLCRAPYVH